MLRKAVATGAVLLVGYLAGMLFGYRAAVVDYVENDAETIESIAGTMYNTTEEEELPDTVQNALEVPPGDEIEDDDESNDGESRAFQ